ncbi:MAG TPA: hypothetical protein VI485_13455 [Vicinamibacterales bacterium]|nr:hypothetical protein [Vicinamibacterales bacterium]
MSIEQSQNQARLLAEAAIGEALVDYSRREDARAARPGPARTGSRHARAARLGLLVALPVLVAVVLVNVWRPSLLVMLAVTGSSTVIDSQVEEALRVVVDDIQSFHADYAELPDSLAELGLPTQGEWVYTKNPDGGYRLIVTLQGRVRTFDGR